MIFRTDVDKQPLDGILRYINGEHSFSFEASSPADVQERIGNGGVASLTVGTLQIEVGAETEAALYVWGYHPRTTWEWGSIDEPTLVPGGIHVDAGEPLEPGVGVQLQPTGAWSTWLDQKTGWVRVARSRTVPSHEVVAIATGIALGISGGELDSILLQPIFD